MKRLFTLTMVLGLLLGMLPQPGLAQDGGGNTIFLPMVTTRDNQATAVTAAGVTQVFINEIHYDNSGTDAGEAIEIAGPAGTGLAGWSLVLYNGNNGSSYNTVALSGTLADAGSGYGFSVVTFPSNGLQNGSPDGIALVNSAGTAIQFLSYEGAFTAVGGPAADATSINIGVGESSGTAVGHSLQLSGTGSEYEDFTWATAQANTFGAVNAGQSFGGSPSAPALVINEIDYDQDGTDSAEFLEIKNVGASEASLSGVTLELVNGSSGGATVYKTIALPDVLLAAGDYFVVCANAATVANCDLDSSPDTNFVQNGSPDGAGLRFNGDLLDAVSYEGDTDSPYVEGSGSGLADDSSDSSSISRCADGVDTDQNNVDFIFTTSTPGGANACAFPGQPLPLSENFDDCTLAGWTIVSVDTDTANTWSCNSTYSNIEANGYGDSPAHEWLITPPLDLDAQDDDALTFRSYTNYADSGIPYPQLAVLYSTDYQGGDPTAATWTALSGITFSPADSGDWVDSGIVDLSGISGQSVSFAFQYQSSGTGGGSAATWRLDEIEFFVNEGPAIITPIHDIQGSGGASPLEGQSVTIAGVVVGDFQNNGGVDSGDLGGFFVQEEDAEVDADPFTSEGIFVHGGSVDVQVGDVVQVSGTVDEYFDFTELANATDAIILGSGASVSPAQITLPADGAALEAVEGMSVTFPQQLVIAEYFNYDRFGEIVLAVPPAGQTVPYQPTAVYAPGSADAAALAALNAASRITLDDGRTSQNPDPALHPNGGEFTLANTFRGGDLVKDATGVLNYSYGLYRIQPTQGATYIPTNPRTASPEAVGGDMKVASFNVLNYFTTFGSRGADDPEEFARQRAKIFAALAAIDADVVGLIEIENNTDAIQDLVDGLNGVVGADTYAYIDTGLIGGDEIKVAFIYKPNAVSPAGLYATLTDPSFTDPNNTGQDKNRPALAQTFSHNSNGAAVTVVVNHLKSKGSECGAGDDDAQQGNCNLTRTLAAQALADWLATDPTGSGDSDVLVMGDLNAYDKEDPINALAAGSDDTVGTGDDFTDLVLAYQGELAYSYVFSGQYGYLDHALGNQNLMPQVTGTTVWHINADEPDILDYDTTFKKDAQDALYEPNAYRSSDHDPVIIGLDLNAPPVCVNAAPSIVQLWPANHKMVAVNVLGVTDPDGDVVSIVIDSIMQDEPSNGAGDGNTDVDGDGVGTSTALVRAERNGGGNGRVYHIGFTADDGKGNNCSGAIQVSVPKSKKKAAVDDGALYDSTQAVSGSSLDAFPPEQIERLYLPSVMR